VTQESRDREAVEESEALALSRRKSTPAARFVRPAVSPLRRGAAPYVTAARIALAQLRRSRLARIGALLLAGLALVALLADVLAPEQAPEQALLPPLAAGHLLGTDAQGRDVLARVAHGARTALGLGFAASMVLVAIGVALGALAGFAGGVIDAVVARAVEAITAVPTLVLVLVVGALVPHPTTATLLWTIALTRWAELARMVRAEVLLTLGTDYVTAARALGASSWRVLRRHVMPNAIGPAIVAAAFGVASVVLVEASVDFLRPGAATGMASWGESLGEARTHPGAWWLIVFPGAALLATLAALHMVGEAAREALDPKLRNASDELTEAMRS
jgi:peptide/nickel transport system permease protein